MKLFLNGLRLSLVVLSAWVLSCQRQNYYETEPAMKADLMCVQVSEVSSEWNSGLEKMTGKLMPQPANRDSVKLVGMATDDPKVVGENYTSKLLLVKNDPVSKNYQYFEKAPLGTPVLWAFYPKDGPNLTELKRDTLIRMRSYRDGIPYAVISVYECAAPKN